jgi:hypothetical protein
MIRLTLSILLLSAGAAFASDSNQMAMALGDVLAAEASCGFAYDQAAIETFIDKNVSADDLQFSSTLNLMTAGSKFSLDQMSASQKTAHCRQVGRVAKSYGFTH